MFSVVYMLCQIEVVHLLTRLSARLSAHKLNT